MNRRIVCATAAVVLLSCGHQAEDAQRTLSSSARTLAVHVNGYVLDLKASPPAVPPELDALEPEPGRWVAITKQPDGRLERIDLPPGEPGVRPASLVGQDPAPAPLVPGARPGKDGERVRPKKWIVQFEGPVGATQRRQLEALGATVGDYLPDFAFLVTMDDTARRAAEQLAGVHGVARYRPAYKIAPGLKDEAGAIRLPKDGAPARLHVRVDGDLGAALAEVLRSRGKVTSAARDVARVELDRRAIARLAQVEDVIFIEEALQPQLFNDTSRWVVQTNVQDQTRIWSAGLHGEGQIVGVGDTGLDHDMCYFRDPTGAPIGPTHRKVVGYVALTDDYDGDMGHGTHVSGTVAGDQRPITGKDTANGMAPLAKLFLTDLTPGESNGIYPPADLGDLFITPYQAGARLHTNSWGASVNMYDTMAWSVDRFMWQHKDFLALFANGNSGPGTGSVGTPANAKNAVSVGATQNGAGDQIQAWFSSNGPTWDGRVKPTISAPGVNIVSADSDGLRDSFNCATVSYSGTSMATPTVAGAAALVRQYYLEGFWPSGIATPADAFVPSAALVKATLVNTAENMTGDYVGGSIPGTGQGWGRINLSDALRFQGDPKLLEVVDFASGLETGATWTRSWFSPGGAPLKITLVWTDYPGSTAASKALVNDLDLEVVAPDGGVYTGNVFAGGVSIPGGTPNRLDVEEQVLIQAAPRGQYTVRVVGYNVPYGPQPFALVVSGAGGVTSTGFVTLDRARYGAVPALEVKVADADLNQDPTVAEELTVTIRSATEPAGEMVRLVESGPDVATFIGSLPIAVAAGIAGDGVLQVADGDSITAEYRDADDGNGVPATVTASAVVDLTPPVISGVQTRDLGQGAGTVTWSTSEPASGAVEYGKTPALGATLSETWLITGHALQIGGLEEATRYYYAVRAVDEAGNVARDDAGGALYGFTTASEPPELSVYSSNSLYTPQPDTLVFGTATDPSGVASVTVNGVAAPWRATDGYYELKVALSVGDNPITVVATDGIGNARTLSFTVTRHPPPDLVLRDLVGPTTGGMAEAVHVEQTLCNVGLGSAPGSGWIGWFLSEDQVLSFEDDLGFQSILAWGDEIAPGECVALPTDVRTPVWDYTAGRTYWLAAYVDLWSQVWESDETNNAVFGNQLLIEGGDPVISSSTAPTQVGTATAFPITLTGKNLGPGATYGADIGLYLSTDATITPGDRLIGSVFTGFLYAGYPFDLTVQVTLPDEIAAGSYYLGAIVDPRGFVTESNEEDNVHLIGPLTVAGPDLHMTAVQAPGAALTGGTVTVHHTVEAAPTGGSAGWFVVTLYLSPDPLITTSDVVLADVPVSPLASGSSLTIDTAVTIPTTLAGGTWYLGAIADSRGAVLETDETDNALAGNAITVTAPDLILTSASAPATGVTGGVLTVPNTVVASATGGGAPAFHVGVFLSTDPVITASDTLIGSREVGPMAPGATSSDDTVATLPTNLPAGTYFVGVIADDFVMTICDYVNDFCTSTIDVAKEPDETNNAYLAGAITVTGPDLTVDAVSADGTAYTGRPLTVHDTVRATGGGTGVFAVAYYLSSDAVITTSDVLLGRRTVVALGADQTSTADTTLTVPLGLAPGPYFIGAVVDSYGGVLESIEGNNALAGNAVAVIGPDLRATAVSGPASVNAGTTVPVNFTVAAAAGLGDAGALRVGLYLSQDQVITSTDQRLGEAYVAGMTAGASVTSTVQVTIPGHLAPGTWYLGAIADSWRQYAEPDETDNAVAGNAVAITPPDLVAVAVSGPSAARTGETVSISSTLTAAPTGAIASGVTFSFYLSSDATITTGDRYVGGRWLSSLGSGETSTADVTVTIPLDVPGGTWYLGAIADPSGSVPESDETNNTIVGGTVAIAAPDLVASAVTGPASGVAGSTIVVDDLVGAAVGGGAAGEFYVGLYLSADPVITPSDTLVGTRWVSGLQPGAASSGSTAVSLPASLPAGTYYLGVIADDFPMYVGDALDGYWIENAVLEPDEGNNALAGPLITIARP